MSRFTDKASSKLEKLSKDQILRIIEAQQTDLEIRSSILNSIDDGVVEISRDGHVLFANTVLSSLIPASRNKKFFNVPYQKIILSQDICSFIESVISGSNAEDKKEFYFSIPGQGEKSVLAISKTMSDSFLFQFRDTTLLNRFKEQFRRNENLASLTTMAASVAHEIKNPLASVSIYLQLLEKKLEKKGSVTKAEAEKYLSVISEEVERINAIAVDFLFAVKPMNVKPALSNLNDIVSKTAEVVGAELEQKQIAFRLNLATSLPKAWVDSSLMQQSILNLVKNSMQAIEENRESALPGAIVVSTYLDGDMIKISVQDNGCGMTEEQMAKVFEPYYSTKAQGTGLGLTVLYKIMKEHSGDIHVDSKKGLGSTFTISLPVPKEERLRISQTFEKQEGEKT